jgi:hypothetical protein
MVQLTASCTGEPDHFLVARLSEAVGEAEEW